jgi:hypothetical protein
MNRLNWKRATKACSVSIAVFLALQSDAVVAGGNCPPNFPDFPDGSLIAKLDGRWKRINRKSDALEDTVGTIRLIYVVNRPSASEGALVLKTVSAKPAEKPQKIQIETDRWNSKCDNETKAPYRAEIDPDSWSNFHATLTSDSNLKRLGQKDIIRFHRNYLSRRNGRVDKDCVWTASRSRGNRAQFLIVSGQEKQFWNAVKASIRGLFSVQEAAAATNLSSKIKLIHYETDETGKACAKVELLSSDWANRVSINDLERKSVRYYYFMRHVGDQQLAD